MRSLRLRRSRESLINQIYVVVHPRTTDTSTSVLYELTTTATRPSISAGESITISCPFKESSIKSYRVAADSIITPASGTDWVANTASDGSGSNITANVAVTLDSTSANSCNLLIENNHATSTAYITTLQVRGTALRDVSQTVFSAIDTSSAFSYGEISQRVDLTFEDRAGEYASLLAQWLLSIHKDPTFLVEEFEIDCNASDYNMTKGLSLEPGSKVTFSETMSGIGTSDSYFVNGCRLSLSPPARLKVSWTLTPASRSAAWILDQVGGSELGLTTNLGFA